MSLQEKILSLQYSCQPFLEKARNSSEFNPIFTWVREKYHYLIGDRPRSAERPAQLNNRSCCAVIAVGSLPHLNIESAFEEFFVQDAEGAILGVPQFTRRTTEHAPILAFKDKVLTTVTESHMDEMNFQVIAGAPDGSIIGIPTVVSAEKISTQFAGGIIDTSSGNIVWDEENFPGIKQRWQETAMQIKKDFDNLNQGAVVDLSKYDLLPQANPGFYTMLNNLQRISQHDGVWAVKLQLATPATILSGFKDRYGTPLNQSPELSDTIRMLTALKNKRMLDMVREIYDGRIILSGDNPDAAQQLATDGSEFINDADYAFMFVRNSPNVSLVEHSCAAIDKPEVFELAGLNGVHLDVFTFPEQIIVNAKAYADFLSADETRMLALGIVPTKGFCLLAELISSNLEKDSVKFETSNNPLHDFGAVDYINANYGLAVALLVKRVEQLAHFLMITGKFENEADLYSRFCISSSCGQGSKSPEAASMIFKLMRDVAKVLREEKLGIKEPVDLT